MKCPGCNRPKRWFQKRGRNSSWHKSCSDSWENGYYCRTAFEDEMYKRIDTITVEEIYKLTNPYNTVDMYKKLRNEIIKKHKFNILPKWG